MCQGIVDMYMEGKIQIDPMITHVMGLDEINTAFDLMHAGKSIRSVVVFEPLGRHNCRSSAQGRPAAADPA